MSAAFDDLDFTDLDPIDLGDAMGVAHDAGAICADRSRRRAEACFKLAMTVRGPARTSLIGIATLLALTESPQLVDRSEPPPNCG